MKLHLFKALCLLLSLCALLCFSACQKNAPPPGNTETKPDPATETKTEDPQETVQATPAKLLSTEKSLYNNFEWSESFDRLLVQSEHSYVTLSETSAASYPKLAQTLSSIATMQEKAMGEEFDNLVSLAKDAESADPASFETYVSTLEVTVRRADSTVLSLLSDSYSHYGAIQNLRVFHGSNFDSESGKELQLSQVVKTGDDLISAVETELKKLSLTGELSPENGIKDFFENTEEITNWVLDYNGITFFFSADEVAEGSRTVTLPFDLYPELFEKKYTAAPKAFAVEFPLDLPFFGQKNTAREAVSVSGCDFDNERLRYTKYGVYLGDRAVEEECFASDLLPYFVKTEQGSYLYLFLEDLNEGLHDMSLVVYSIHSDGSIKQCGKAELSPAWQMDHRFTVPNDPAALLLSELGSAALYSVGADGLPAKLAPAS